LVSSGVPSLDDYLGGGLVEGDNLVWFADELEAVDPFCRAFAEIEPERCVWFSFGSRTPPSVPGVRGVRLSTDAVAAASGQRQAAHSYVLAAASLRLPEAEQLLTQPH
jgi:hypothetical protein